MDDRYAFWSVRVALAAIWAYEGLWLKVVLRDSHELRIVASASAHVKLPGLWCLVGIGLGETLLAALVLLGLWPKPLAWLQGIALAAMNLGGIFLGGGEIGDPIYLLIHNLPTFACVVVYGLAGSLKGRE